MIKSIIESLPEMVEEEKIEDEEVLILLFLYFPRRSIKGNQGSQL